MKSKAEKIEEIKRKEQPAKSKEEKLSLAKEKKMLWTEWRGGRKHPEQKQVRSDEIDQSTPKKQRPGGGGGTGGDPEMGKPTPPTTTPPTQPPMMISPIVGEMFIGSAEIRYSHCAERHRRHFQEGVYSTYERAMRLGTIPEERMKLQL